MMQLVLNCVFEHFVGKWCSWCIQDLPSILDVCGWKPFLEREDLIVWRKEDEVHHGLYIYKGVHCVLKYKFLNYKNTSEISWLLITSINISSFIPFILHVYFTAYFKALN